VTTDEENTNHIKIHSTTIYIVIKL